MSIWFELAITIVLTVFGVITGKAWYVRLKYRWALEIIETVVAWVYQMYVEPKKKDGTFQDEEKETAKNMAMNQTIAVGKDQGVDILKAIGKEHLEKYVEKAVVRLQERIRR